MLNENLRAMARPFFIALGLSAMVWAGWYVGKAWLQALPEHGEICSEDEKYAYTVLAQNANAAHIPVVAGCFVFTFAVTARRPAQTRA